jgi:inosine-uridine nucleoside N-ribohydrolase
MKVAYQLYIICLILSGCLVACDSPAKEDMAITPVKIILDTDFGNDCDDTGALAILHQMSYNGEVEILATIYPMNDSLGATAIDAVNTYYGAPSIPIGTFKGDYVYKGTHNDFYNSRLVNGFSNDLKSGSNAPDAVALYRKVLASQPDQSVTIVVVGPQRVVADLLKSAPDEFSSLDGKALIEKKVKALVSMGAEYPTGYEWNIRIAPDAAKLVAEEWPTPVYYSGFEIGKPVMTGERLISETPESNPVRIAFETNPMVDSVKNRHSWDQTAVLYAVRGDGDVWTTTEGSITILDDGHNTWQSEKKNRFFLTAVKSPAEIKKIIEDMMVAPPKNNL